MDCIEIRHYVTVKQYIEQYWIPLIKFETCSYVEIFHEYIKDRRIDVESFLFERNINLEKEIRQNLRFQIDSYGYLDDLDEDSGENISILLDKRTGPIRISIQSDYCSNKTAE